MVSVLRIGGVMKVSDERFIKAVKAAERTWHPLGDIARELGMSRSRFDERVCRLRKAGKL